MILLVFKKKPTKTKKNTLYTKKKNTRVLKKRRYGAPPLSGMSDAFYFGVRNRHTARCKRVVRYCPLCGDGACGKVRCRSEPIHETAVPLRLSSTPDGVELFKTHWSTIQTGVRTNGVRVSIVNIRLPTGELSDGIDSVR